MRYTGTRAPCRAHSIGSLHRLFPSALSRSGARGEGAAARARIGGGGGARARARAPRCRDDGHRRQREREPAVSVSAHTHPPKHSTLGWIWGEMPGPRLTLLLWVLARTAAQPLHGCCCSTPIDSVNDVSTKVVYGCQTVRCDLIPSFNCGSCLSADISEACRFCQQPTQRMCAKAPPCASWCALTRQCQRFAMCLGCTSCDATGVTKAEVATATIGLASPPPPVLPPPVHAPHIAICQSWCEAHPADWSRKCEDFSGCSGCADCSRGIESTAQTGSLVVRKPRVSSPLVDDLDPFLADAAIPVLPLLNVTYRFRDRLGHLITRAVQGTASRLSLEVDAEMLARAPSSITWTNQPGFVAGSGQRQVVIMMDIDAGGRSSAEGDQPGPDGITVLAVWTDCTNGKLDSCRALIPYAGGTSPRKGTNRYVFMVLQQPTSYLRAIGHVTAFPHWDFASFLSANWPEWWSERFEEGKDVLCPAVAANFMYVSRTQADATLDPRRFPAWVDDSPSPPPTPPPPPPHPLLPPSGPSPPPRPVATWWGGFELKSPWEAGYVAAPMHTGSEARSVNRPS